MLAKTPSYLLRRREKVADIIVKGLERREAAKRETRLIELGNGAVDRDEGMARVAAGSADFFDRAMAIISGMGAWTGTGEQLRLLIGREVAPVHHNAWGALVGNAIRKGLLARTGERRSMVVRSSHRRMTDVYVRTVGAY